MNIIKYINLLERRSSLGKNIGALDFLIKLSETRLFMQSSNEAHDEFFTKSQKYRRLKELNGQIGNNPRGNEFGYLLEYASLLRSVQMTQTYIEIVRYLITKIKELNRSQRIELLKHVRAAYIVSGDTSFFDLIQSVGKLKIEKISLPKIIIGDLLPRYNNFIQTGSEIQDDVFSNQNNLPEIKRILNNRKNELLIEQTHGLMIIKSRLEVNQEQYTKSINELFKQTGLNQISEINLSSNNILSTIRCDTIRAKQEYGMVSIIMSCFNSEKTIEYSLESILNQTYKNIEVLICDDRSDDESLTKIINIAKRDDRVKVFRSRENQGTYNIRNALLHEINGEFITFQDSDDWSHPQRIEQQVDFLISNHISVCSTRWVRIDHQGKVIFFIDGRILRFCVVSTMVRRSAFSIVPKFRQSLVAADTEFHETCLKFFGEDKVKILEKTLLLGLWGDGSLTKKDGLQADNNGRVDEKRRRYSDIAARQRVLGSRIISDTDVDLVLKASGIYREYKNIERLEVNK